MFFLDKLKAGLSKTRQGIIEKIDQVLVSLGKVDEELFEELEEILISADVGVNTTLALLEQVKARVKERRITDALKVRDVLMEEMIGFLPDAQKGLTFQTKPSVLLVVGVNGVGKTTTIGKLAHQFKADGKKVLLAAGDTFRAAAIEQLEIWAGRVGVDLIKHTEGSDPAAVVFDATVAAKSRNVDLLICDTAGRLHTKKNLMEELKKIRRILHKELPQASVEVLLVLDATTGQNAISQAKVFKEVVDLTGLVLTKLDGTAKGGMLVSVAKELALPIHYIGIGEKVEDLQKFNANQFITALFESAT